MKLSTLIIRLQTIHAQTGDIDVHTFKDDFESEDEVHFVVDEPNEGFQRLFLTNEESYLAFVDSDDGSELEPPCH